MTPPGLDQSQAGPSDLSKYQPYPDQAQRRGGDKGFASPELSSSFSTRSTDSEEEWQKDRRYAVVVDAGSSGSRMQVYSWKNPPVEKSLRETSSESTNVLPTVEKGTWDESKIDWQLKVEPGISTFGSHPEDLEPYLSKLFTYALSIIPTSEQSRTPVYMLATAGMRLLPSSQRNDILARTCSFIKERTPFDVGVDAEGCKKHVQVITGEEEGLLGWIAINYLMDGFQFREGPGATTPVTVEGGGGGATKEVDMAKQKSTYGFLDMGGASTQIAFEPSAKALASTKQGQMAVDGLATVRLRMLDGTDVESNVFVTTFLGFGTNKARERYVEQLVHVNTQQTSTSGAAAESNAHTAALPDPCLPTGLVLPADSSPHVSVVGTGSFQACMAFLKPLLQREASCSHPPCLFDGVYVPPIDFSVNHFIGVSEYWYSTNDVFGLGGVYDWAGFQKAAIAYCSRPWEELKRDFDRGKWKGKNVDQNRLRMQCFKSAWMTTILHEGIGIPRINDRKGKGDGEDHAKAAQNLANDKNLFQSVNDIRGLSVSWTLGKAILEASRGIPSRLGQLQGDVAGQMDTGLSNVRPGPGNLVHASPFTGTGIGRKTDGAYIDRISGVQLRPNVESLLLVFVLAMLALSAIACSVINRTRSSRAPRPSVRGCAYALFSLFSGNAKGKGKGKGRRYLYERINDELALFEEGARTTLPLGSNSEVSSEDDDGFVREHRHGAAQRRTQPGAVSFFLRALLPPSWRAALVRSLRSTGAGRIAAAKRRRLGKRKATAAASLSTRGPGDGPRQIHGQGCGNGLEMRMSRPGSPSALVSIAIGTPGSPLPAADGSRPATKRNDTASSSSSSISRPSSRAAISRPSTVHSNANPVGQTLVTGMTPSRPPSRINSPSSATAAAAGSPGVITPRSTSSAASTSLRRASERGNPFDD